MGPIWDAHLRPDSLPAWVELKPGLPTMPLVGADCAGCGQLVRLSFPPSWVDKLQTVSGFRNQKANPAHGKGMRAEPGCEHCGTYSNMILCSRTREASLSAFWVTGQQGVVLPRRREDFPVHHTPHSPATSLLGGPEAMDTNIQSSTVYNYLPPLPPLQHTTAVHHAVCHGENG